MLDDDANARDRLHIPRLVCLVRLEDQEALPLGSVATHQKHDLYITGRAWMLTDDDDLAPLADGLALFGFPTSFELDVPPERFRVVFGRQSVGSQRRELRKHHERVTECVPIGESHTTPARVGLEVGHAAF
jgi:hypothetical protein